MSSMSIGKINSTVFEFEWKINVDSCFTSKSIGEKVLSPIFTNKSFGRKIKWCLLLYPKGSSKGQKNYVSLYLRCLNSFPVPATVIPSFSDVNNKKVNEVVIPKHSFNISKPFGISNFVDQDFVTDPKNKLIKNNQITILCKIIIDSSILDEDKSKFCEPKISDDFEKLLVDEKFTDLTVISADGKKLLVHKGILAARSPVFEAMFEHEMLEKKQNSVEIKDIDHVVLLELFRFMYCRKVNNIETLLCELLRAAEKYSVEGLKITCEETMLLNLDKKNAIEYLIEAYQNNSTIVKIIIDFIVKYSKEIVKSTEFKLLGVSYPDLMYKIVTGIVYKKNTE